MKQAKRQHLQIDSKAIKQEYRAILTRAKDIGKSRLMSSYCMGAYFIALNRNTTLSPEECYALYKDGLSANQLFHKVMGNADSYLDAKKLPARKKWSTDSHKRKYENDWVVDILEGGANEISSLAMIIIHAASAVCAGMRAVSNLPDISAAWTMCLPT